MTKHTGMKGEQPASLLHRVSVNAPSSLRGYGKRTWQGAGGGEGAQEKGFPKMLGLMASWRQLR